MPDNERRSLDRREHIIVRMSKEERANIREAAAAMDTSMNDLVRNRIGDLLVKSGE